VSGLAPLPPRARRRFGGPRGDHERISAPATQAIAPGNSGPIGTRLLWAILGSNHVPGLF
jgi:hypothetical protein